jgi:hypothetical protein
VSNCDCIQDIVCILNILGDSAAVMIDQLGPPNKSVLRLTHLVMFS